jgi:hypothetical protein
MLICLNSLVRRSTFWSECEPGNNVGWGCDGAAVGRLCMDQQHDAGESQPRAVEAVSVATSVATAESEESDEPKPGHTDDPDEDVTQTTKFATRQAASS